MDLQNRLKQKQVTKAELARHFNVHWNTVNNWCKNPENLKLSLINDISTYLDNSNYKN